MTASQIPTGDRIVGVDAGGTLVRLAVSQPGAPLSEALVMTTPASEDGGPEPLISLLKLAPLDPSEVLGAVAGVTKVSRPGVTDRWEDLLRAVFPNATLRVVPDFQIAYHGAISGGIGVAALAGTGSVIYGEDAQGNRARVGGRGWEYGDEGSGAWLTTEALRRTLRALDGFETSATLARLVGGYLKETEDAGRLAQSAREAAREQGRGFLVPILADAARSGDTEAANLFVGAAGWLAAQVRAALRRLSFPAESSLVVARAGGLWEVGPLLIDPFERVLRRWHPEATVIAPDGSPLVGSLRLAQSLLASR